MIRLEARQDLGVECRRGDRRSVQDRIEDDRRIRAGEGPWPVAISYRTAPNEKRSLRVSTDSPRACSGDM